MSTNPKIHERTIQQYDIFEFKPLQNTKDLPQWKQRLIDFYNENYYLLNLEMSNHDIDRINLDLWHSECVERQTTTYIRNVLQSFYNNLTYVSYNEFIFTIRNILTETVRVIGNDDFYVYMPFIELYKSNFWLFLIILDIIIYMENFKGIIAYTIQNNSGEWKNIIMLDDGIYSGNQFVQSLLPNSAIAEYGVKEALENKLTKSKCLIYLVCMFIGESAINVLSPVECIIINPLIYTSEKLYIRDLPPYSKSSSVEELELFDLICDIPEFCTTTYFQHKLADTTSLPLGLIEGKCVGTDNEIQNIIKGCKGIRGCPKAVYKKFDYTMNNKRLRHLTSSEDTVLRNQNAFNGLENVLDW
jgi:hypothetical protein